MKIGIDAMGGDFAPLEVVNAALEHSKDSAVKLVLYGEKDALSEFENALHNAGVQIVLCGNSITMGEHGAKAVVTKKDSSINVGMAHLGEGVLDAFVGSGNTGAMMVSAMYNIKTIGAIDRPALSTVLPQVSGVTGLLLDVGANADVKPETLVNFAILGTEFVQTVYNIQNPRVGLLNIGEEEEKGNNFTRAAFPLLKANKVINFIGNIEGRHLFNDMVDVVVCDGFTGNIVVKTCEAMYYNLAKRQVNDEFLDRFNFKYYGGTPILGVKKPVIVGHGISKAGTIKNMINLAKDVVMSDLSAKIERSIATLSQ
jgi:glycerol-3-phosphate acyltransferase PlsX